MDQIGTVRARFDQDVADYFIKVGDNNWAAVYTQTSGEFAGEYLVQDTHYNDTFVSRYPVVVRPR